MCHLRWWFGALAEDSAAQVANKQRISTKSDARKNNIADRGASGVRGHQANPTERQRHGNDCTGVNRQLVRRYFVDIDGTVWARQKSSVGNGAQNKCEVYQGYDSGA